MRHRSRRLIGMTVALVLLLSPAWALASALESPADGGTVSGIGVISGWKCDAVGDITVRFDGGNLVPLLYGSARGDTGVTSVCNDDGLNGFVAIWNWSILRDGEHTVIAYDDGVEFDRSTFSVVNFGQERVEGAAGECMIDDFPATGETATFEWNESTQHLELAEITGAPEDPEDPEDMELDLAQFDGTWDARLTSSGCPLTEIDIEVACEISDGSLTCPGGVAGTITFSSRDSSWSVIGTLEGLLDGVFSGTIEEEAGAGSWQVLGCTGMWTLTKQ